jgi:quercetin dioxygenase-like cupin family protein
MINCLIIIHMIIGLSTLRVSRAFHVNKDLACRDLAEAAKGPHGAVVETLGKHWLLSIEDEVWRAPSGGEHIADIGPLPVKEGAPYTALYMEAVFNPGMTAPAHVHAGPEAWYTLAGETCLETPDGVQIGRAGGQNVIVPGGPPMHLTATVAETRPERRF